MKRVYGKGLKGCMKANITATAAESFHQQKRRVSTSSGKLKCMEQQKASVIAVSPSSGPSGELSPSFRAVAAAAFRALAW